MCTKVKQLANNQFQIYNATNTVGGEVWTTGIAFQSYDSIVAFKANGKRYLDERYWKYSKTTSKYRNMFLNEDTTETQKKIDSGEYMLVDLNSGA